MVAVAIIFGLGFGTLLIVAPVICTILFRIPSSHPLPPGRGAFSQPVGEGRVREICSRGGDHDSDERER